jgi:hypothetical protein
MDIKFENSELKNVYDLAKKDGLRVLTSMKSNRKTTYFFITDGTRFVSCEARYSGVIFSSSHKPTGKGIGTGFVLTEGHVVGVTTEDINELLECKRPQWAMRYGPVEKYKNWEEFENRETILKYREI